MTYKISLSNLSSLPHFSSFTFLPMFPSEALHYVYAKEHCFYNMLPANMCSTAQCYFKSTEKSQNKETLSLDFFIIEPLISPLLQCCEPCALDLRWIHVLWGTRLVASLVFEAGANWAQPQARLPQEAPAARALAVLRGGGSEGTSNFPSATPS